MIAPVVIGLLMSKSVILNPRVGFQWEETTEPCGIISNTSQQKLTRSVALNAGNRDFIITTLIENLHHDAEKRYPYYSDGKEVKAILPGYSLCLVGNDTLSIEVDGTQIGYEPFTRVAPQLKVRYRNQETIISPKDFKWGQPTIYIIKREGDTITLEAGTAIAEEQWRGQVDATFEVNKVDAQVNPGGEIDVKYLHAEICGSDDWISSASLTPEELNESLSATGNPHAGYWRLSGHTIDEKQVRIGGDYMVALLPLSSGDFVIYYVDGGKVNGGSWQSGRVKGRLLLRQYPRYDVEWIDAEGEVMSGGYGVFGTDGMLRLRFPYLGDAEIILQK